MLSCRLARKGETNSFAISFIVNDEIVALGLAGEITVDHFRGEQVFPFTTFFQLVVDGPHFIAYKCLIILHRFSTLFELPLPLEQSGFVNEGEDIVQWEVVNNARSVKRERGDSRIFSHMRPSRMGCVTDSLQSAARFRRFANSQLRFFSNEVLDILASVYLLPIFRCLCLCDRRSIAAYQLIHRMQSRERVASVEKLAAIEGF